jgi:Zn2+/Cd2+-exporting ATPase
MQEENSSIHINVILSGIFWFVSLLSYVGGNWEYLKYVGLLSVAFGMPPVARKAWRTLRRWQFDANCMMVVAAFGALALQEYDEAASVSFLFAISEFLESRATTRSRKALGAIISQRPEHCNVVHPLTRELVIVPAEKVPVGSLIAVRTGDKIAADGVVVEGSSTVDESSLTGEALPIMRRPGDNVAGGAINVGDSQLIIKTTSSVEDSAVSRLIRLVEEAQTNRSPTEKLVDAFAKRYTPAVMLMAGLMCTIPWIWGPELGRYWTLNGLIIIVIACPCALTISTPVTYAAGLAATAQRGVIVKGGANLEALGSVETVIFDKTGTLTNGKFVLSHLEVVGTAMKRQEMLGLLAMIESPSSHPLSATLVAAAKTEGVPMPREKIMVEHTVLKGEGVKAMIDGKLVYAGNRRLFERLGMYDALQSYKEMTEGWSKSGGTVGFLGLDGVGIVGTFSVSDAVRPEAREVIRQLTEGGIDVIMLTGDSDGAAKAVAREVGLPESKVHSQLLPEDKLHFVGSLIEPQAKRCTFFAKKRLVLMCGDGINDAP